MSHESSRTRLKGLEENSEERVSILQMNSELRHAQLELLSAHCATHQLRLRYNTDELIRFGRRDLLRKSAETASALNSFYSSIEKQIDASPQTAPPLQPAPEQIEKAVEWLAAYLRAQREHYLTAASPLNTDLKAVLAPYFSSELLARVRILELKGARISAPDFYAQARDMGYCNLPEVNHMDSLTFLDVIVFNQELELRALFHALVHTIQMEMLGTNQYCEAWITTFLKTRTYFTVPCEVHAFSLASKFVRPKPERFSVEQQVALWIAEDRYRTMP